MRINASLIVGCISIFFFLFNLIIIVLEKPIYFLYSSLFFLSFLGIALIDGSQRVVIDERKIKDAINKYQECDDIFSFIHNFEQELGITWTIEELGFKDIDWTSEAEEVKGGR